MSWAVAVAQLSSLIALAPSDTAVPQIPDSIVIDLLAKLPRSSIVRRPIVEVTWESLTNIAMRLKTHLKPRSSTRCGKE